MNRPAEKQATLYLIPTFLSDDEAGFRALPPYLLEAIKKCTVFFTEQEKTARRYFKKWWKEMVIDDYTWYATHHADKKIFTAFNKHLQQGDTIGIVSEAGCPGIADPGQELVAIAHAKGAKIIPLVGPNAILLALMASGMNGQAFRFAGYLPIESGIRKTMIRQLEKESLETNCTQIFIETPYRNNTLLNDILSACRAETRLCIAVNITGLHESIHTKTIKEWKVQIPDLHKKPAIFLLQTSSP